MQRFIAFLRAINVGGHTVKMEHLRNLFEGIGLSGVETFIASGNVIFESRSKDEQALEKKIERHLEQSLGYPVGTFLRSPTELAAVARHKPFPSIDTDADGLSLYVGFLKSTPEKDAVKKLVSFRNDTDDFHVRGREVYWLLRSSMRDSTFSGAKLEKTLAMPATMRNVTTVRRLAERTRQR